MQIKTRYLKILNDIWGNKTRSLLVILSIAIGVGIVGIINNARYMIEDDLYSQYEQGNPASVSLYLSPFPEELLNEVKNAKEIKSAEARSFLTASITPLNSTGEEKPESQDMVIVVTPNFEDIQVNQLTLLEGTDNLRYANIALEKQTAKALGVTIGDLVMVELDNGNKYSLKVQAIMQNIYDMPYSITGQTTGFINTDTLELLGGMPLYNRLDIVVSDEYNNKDDAIAIATDLRDNIIQPAGYFVGSIQIPGIDSDPGEHWAQNQISGFVLILQVMSIMAIFLSGGLVVNTITAILTQQVKQIGIMRSIGAVPSQITGMFILNVFIFSLIGWALAIPIGMLGSYGLSAFAASFLNYQVTGIRLSPDIFILQTVIAFLVPVGVALYPIIAGTSIKIYDAIYQQGLVNQDQKPWLERLVTRLKFLSPPNVLSLLNTFRNVPRLVITLVTLTLAGATFVAAFSTRASLNAQIDQFFRYTQYDVSIPITDPMAELEDVQQAALDIPDVDYAEGWASAGGVLLREDNSEGAEIEIVGLPYDTQTIDPKMEAGRWLNKEDKWGVVVNQDLTNQEDQIQVGSEMVVKIMGSEYTFTVVGITSKHLVGPRLYLNYPTFSEISGREGQINSLRVRTSLDELATKESQTSLALNLEETLSDKGYTDASAQIQSDIADYLSEPFGIILMVLVIMAGLLAVVGGLSLAGTMGINVMERTREIGVLRSVGASNGAVRQVVVLEGIVIAVLSWLLVAAISGPTGAALAGAVMNAVLKTELTFSYSFSGLFTWLALIIVIGTISSLTPAGKAVRLTVREVLNYE